MCFRNLPIEFDGSGTARLREGVSDPYGVTTAPRRGYVRRREKARAPSWPLPRGFGTGTSTP